jgi:Leucine-rich repeat (LRR) protein
MQSKLLFIQTKYLWVFCALIISLFVSSCKNYSVSVNEKVVYTPPSIFKDFQIADQQLFDCVQQTIYDLHITRAEDLTQLNCSNAGIKSLLGLDKFFALKELNLADNKIADIAVIGNMGRLEVLKLSGNQIKNPAPLLHLLHLKNLDMQENPSMVCKDLAQLIANQNKATIEILLPGQCVN